MLFFFDLNDLKLVKLLCEKKKLTVKPTRSQQTDANVTIKNKICNFCVKTNSKTSLLSRKPVKNQYTRNV